MAELLSFRFSSCVFPWLVLKTLSVSSSPIHFLCILLLCFTASPSLSPMQTGNPFYIHLPHTQTLARTHSCTLACTHTLAHPLTCFCSPNVETHHFLVRIQLYPLCYKNHSGPGSLLLNKIKWLSWPGRVAHTWRTAESSKPGWDTVMMLFQKQKTRTLRPRKSESGLQTFWEKSMFP